MRLQVELLTEDGFPEMVARQWESFENPFHGLIRIASPIFNNDRTASLATDTEVQIAFHKASQPEANWIKVVDLDAGGVLAGAARWVIYERNPFEKEEKTVAVWYPEGSVAREYAGKVLDCLFAPRMKMARRPHLCNSLPLPPVLTVVLYWSRILLLIGEWL